MPGPTTWPACCAADGLQVIVMRPHGADGASGADSTDGAVGLLEVPEVPEVPA